ncbi:MAG: rod shape-determining protein MreC [Actinobacteria bacterium]|jgi:rod shape-determining protein MreC|nr:rod shape-determining protein MreC [Actinomycetota bacterium]MBT3746946.1 rod shape-determining protein MreC [Actinomycetota bacterium]MBT3970498.1 rod shape-determining protein MreC [Actinomycetota bacterium]MBT4008914.1 rod shape-determining protein MreC [Actinomycetota bacterium]MBT4302755.1 rod shape-determining protein MreC [Actinomycetota bacterium]
MAAPRPAERPRHTLLIILAAALTLLTLQIRGAQPLDALQQGVRDIISPVRTLVDRGTDPLQNVWSGIFNYGSLEAENERLANELARVRGLVLSDEADRELLERLLGEIDIAYTDLDTVIARILGTPPGNFGTHLVEIDKGSDDGLQEGQAVVTGAGLVGRLTQVDRERSIVILATHPDFSVGVRLVESQDEGLASGTGGYELRIEAGVRLDAVIALNEVVVTAGGRSRFPADIPVGRVTVPDNYAEYERSIRVEMAASLENLSFLNVVINNGADN